MQKIKNMLFNRMIESDLTRLELRFLFFLASRCDVGGNIEGVYYAEIAEEMECSVAKFYHLRDGLTRKGFIQWEKNNSADIDICILDNSFLLNGKPVYQDYVDINISIFQDPAFFKQKAKAVQTGMEFIRRVAANEAVTYSNSSYLSKEEAEKKRKLWYLSNNEYKKLSQKLNVSQRMVKKYLESLKQWINIQEVEKEDKLYHVVTVLKHAVMQTVCCLWFFPRER